MAVQGLHDHFGDSEKAVQGLHDRFTHCERAVQVLHSPATHCEMAAQGLHTHFGDSEMAVQGLHGRFGDSEKGVQGVHGRFTHFADITQKGASGSLRACADSHRSRCLLDTIGITPPRSRSPDSLHRARKPPRAPFGFDWAVTFGADFSECGGTYYCMRPTDELWKRDSSPMGGVQARKIYYNTTIEE